MPLIYHYDYLLDFDVQVWLLHMYTCIPIKIKSNITLWHFMYVFLCWPLSFKFFFALLLLISLHLQVYLSIHESGKLDNFGLFLRMLYLFMYVFYFCVKLFESFLMYTYWVCFCMYWLNMDWSSRDISSIDMDMIAVCNTQCVGNYFSSFFTQLVICSTWVYLSYN